MKRKEWQSPHRLGATWLIPFCGGRTASSASRARKPGRGCAIALDEAFRPLAAPVEITLVNDRHASFPLVFSYDGATYLLPETSAAGSVDLYRCEQMPQRWRLERRLLENIDAVDTVPLYHAGRWWLFTSVRRTRADGGHRALAIFFCEDLLVGEWQPHPINAERRYADSPFSWGRCAGPIIAAADGTWLRPFQASRRYYGEAFGWMRIEVLTPTEFRERVMDAGSWPLASCVRGLSPHHFATCDNAFVCDVRDRVSYRQDVPILRRWALRPTVASFEDCTSSREPVR